MTVCKRRSFLRLLRAGRKVSEITSGETTSLRVHCMRRVCTVCTSVLKLRPHLHTRPIESSITKGAWFPRGCILLSCKEGKWEREKEEMEAEEGKKKKEEEVGGKREGNRLSTRSINRGEKIRRQNRTKIALITIITIIRATQRVNIVVVRD